MALLTISKPDRYTIVVGCGRLGSTVADMLSAAGAEVLVLDKDARALDRLPASFGGLARVGDATDLATLEEASITAAQAVVIVTNDDITNIMVAQMARELFGVEHVIARVYDPSREEIYVNLGIETVCPVRHSASVIEHILLGGDAA